MPRRGPPRVARAGVGRVRPQDREGRRRDDQRHEQSRQRQATRLHRGDLVIGGKVVERVQHRDQDGHRERLREDERDRVKEDFGDHGPVEPLADQVLEPLAHLVQKEQQREAGHGEEKRRHMEAQ